MLPSKYVFKSLLKRLGMCVLDGLGSILFFATPKNQKINGDGLKKVLMVRFDHFGDMLLSRPALSAFHQQFPNTEIHWLLPDEYTSVAVSDSFIHEAIGFQEHWYSKKHTALQKMKGLFSLARKLKKENFDAAIDLRGDFRTLLLLFLARIPIRISFPKTGGGFLLTHSVDYSEDRHQVLQSAKLLSVIHLKDQACTHNPEISFGGSDHLLSEPEKRVVVHPSSGDPDKRLSSEQVMKLIGLIQKEYAVKIIIVGTEKEKSEQVLELPQSVLDMRGKTSLGELTQLLKESHIFIGTDSGPAHLAAAQGMHIILLPAGTNRIEHWHPWTHKLSQIPLTGPFQKQDMGLVLQTFRNVYDELL